MSHLSEAIIGALLGVSLAFNMIFVLFIVHEVRCQNRQRAKEIAKWDKQNGFNQQSITA